MTLLTRVRGLISDDGTVYECRHCGTTLESNIETCPQCGRGEIVAYEIG